MSQSLTQTRQKMPAIADAGPQQYLTFSLGGEVFALGILNVKEIIEFGNITEIPMMPAFIRGVINLRGAVVPVIDLSARFGGETSAVSRRTCIVIVELGDGDDRQDLGVIVDAVNEVLEIPRGDIEPPPSFGAKIRADFIQGMGKVDNRFVIILNVDRVLSTEEITMLASMGGDSAKEEG
ncbi:MULTISPECIES: chemotaxis protein CheW [unclassified Thauera]|uniref:chemotaxis protein CheW n=1 Tax=unclassified Thauera TaxID=2609274 RepID=UPI0002CDD30B|nr:MULTISPECIES: chemotaxis protein CheW [unclassified Thauera]ENO81923.1 positive regulator of CheA protein activity [Thauera sp. 27]ENO90793.1 positive regulator of CheA protein activity [Thauera sp. 28]WBL64445.1 chemotaxis protein CheW [Thauera sp. WB-2]HRK09953.1 chemotaxis protein CheW [Thauera sp.]